MIRTRATPALSQRVEKMMGAEDVGSKRIADVVEGMADVRSAGAVIHDAGYSNSADRSRDGFAIEQVDVLAPQPDEPSRCLQVLDEVAPREAACAGDQSLAHDREPYCVW